MQASHQVLAIFRLVISCLKSNLPSIPLEFPLIPFLKNQVTVDPLPRQDQGNALAPLNKGIPLNRPLQGGNPWGDSYVALVDRNGITSLGKRETCCWDRLAGKNNQNGIKNWFILVLLIFSLFLTSCSGLNGSTQDDNITKLTLWHGINPPPNRDVFQELVAEFNETHEQIKVESIYIGQPDGQLPKILTAVVGDVPPDMLWFVPQLTGQLVDLGAIRSLDDWLNQSPLKDEIDPVLLESMELNDQIWSVPLGTNNAGIFYRPSLFEEAGIEKIPETWDELEATAKKLTQDFDRDGRIDQQGMFLSLGKGEWTVFTWLPFVYSADGELLTENNQPNLVNEGTISALEFGAKLVENDWAMLSAPERGYELDNFLSGQVAMQVTGPWTLGQLSDIDIDYDVFPFPKKEQQAAVVGGENLFVFKTNSEREKACFEFLEYVLSETFQTEWALRTGYLPVNVNSQQSERYQQFVKDNPVLEVFLEQMKVAKVRPIIPNYNRLSENFGRAIEASLLGEKEPKTALEESQRRLELIFADDRAD